MRKVIIVCLTAIMLAASVSASARGYGYRGYGGHGHGYRYRNYGANAGFFVGGLLLGSLLQPPRYVYAPPQVVYTPAPRVVYRSAPRVVYVPQATTVAPPVTYSQPTQATVTRSLLRDINGNCFERKFNDQGEELRTQLPAQECVW